MATKFGMIGVALVLTGALTTAYVVFIAPGKNTRDLTFVDGGTIGTPTQYDTYTPRTARVDEATLSKKDSFSEWGSTIRRGIFTVAEPKNKEVVSEDAPTNKPSRKISSDPELITLDGLGVITHTNTNATKDVLSEEDQLKKVIHEYGNTIGQKIHDMVIKNGDQNEALGVFVKNKNTESYSDIKNIGDNYIQLAKNIDDTLAPHGFSESAHRLSLGYTGVGNQLLAFSGKNTDEAIYAQILIYNGSVETFGESFIALAQLFGAYGVKFSPDEPGGIFSPAVTGF